MEKVVYMVVSKIDDTECVEFVAHSREVAKNFLSLFKKTTKFEFTSSCWISKEVVNHNLPSLKYKIDVQEYSDFLSSNNYIVKIDIVIDKNKPNQLREDLGYLNLTLYKDTDENISDDYVYVNMIKDIKKQLKNGTSIEYLNTILNSKL